MVEQVEIFSPVDKENQISVDAGVLNTIPGET